MLITAAFALTAAPAQVNLSMLDARIEAALNGYQDALDLGMDGVDGDTPTIVAEVRWCHRKSLNRYRCKLTVKSPSRVCAEQMIVAKRVRKMRLRTVRTVCAARGSGGTETRT